MTLELLYVGDNRETIEKLVSTADVSVCVVETPDDALNRLAVAPFDALVVSDTVSDITTFLSRVDIHPSSLPIVVETESATTLPAGVYDEAVPPAAVDQLTDVVDALVSDATSPAGTRDDSRVSLGDGGVSTHNVGTPSFAEGVGNRTFANAVVRGLPDVLFLADLDGNLLRWNDRLNAVTGYTDSEIRSSTPSEFFQDGLDVREKVTEMREDTDIRFTADLVTRDGSVIPYELTASLVDCGGEQYICGVGRDITERREAEQQLDEAVEELEESNTELEQFAYVASHDMKEPLRMVSSYLELLERRYGDELDGDAQEFIDFAVEGSERMREMINGLLAYSRVGRQTRDFERIDVGDVLDTAQSNLRIAIEESGAVVEAGELPTVHGDPGQLTQLFQNLVANAIKYTDEGRPRITVSAAREGDEWTFTVSDDGIGIPESRQESIFEIFSGEGGQSGSGIGLAICEKIVDHHGGRIWVESDGESGTTFHFTIPDVGQLGDEGTL
ncbi:sensor histidine kinase [Halogranum rubrum]|uniref:histidine kinase n=1 Tax=Halogranum salarium B-1 TaxID=1210908 RepID=J2Z993_9EURY|nr:ATP-binding protein [Halogranum salarium]EJN57195.1 hypothetical protein HSB1_45810 [Halogranum salarium B-1]